MVVIGIDNRGRGTRGGNLKARDGHYRASHGYYSIGG